jgi:hypothetical protein
MAIHRVAFRGVHAGQSPNHGISVTASPLAFVSSLLAISATALGLAACDRAQLPEDSRSRATPTATPTVTPAVTPPRTSAGGSETPAVPSLAASAQRADPKALLSLSTSAYQASLAVDADAAYLLTSHAAYRLVPGRAPEELRIELGYGASATAHGLVFWSEGAVREASKQSGTSHRIAALAARPQFFVSSGDDLAWVARAEDSRYSLGSVAGKRPFTAYTSPGSIDAAAMLGGWVFFVERPTEAEWRIGAVRAEGGAPVSTSTRRGRAPSMLVAHHEIYYYDGNGREVRRLSPDLRDEKVLVSDFVCSPLAVAERVYCANVEGIFELVPDGRPRPLVTLGLGATVSDLAADGRRLFWVADAGPDKLVVNAIEVADPPAP